MSNASNDSNPSPIEKFRAAKPGDRLTFQKSEIQSIIGAFNEPQPTAPELQIQRFVPKRETPPFNDGAVVNATLECLLTNDPAICGHMRNPEGGVEVLGWCDLTPSAHGEIHQTPSPKPAFASGPRRVGIVVKVRRPVKVDGKEKAPVFIAYLPPDKALMAGVQGQNVTEIGHAYRIGSHAPHEARMLDAFDGNDDDEKTAPVNIYANPTSVGVVPGRNKKKVYQSPVTEDGRYNGAKPGGSSRAGTVQGPVIPPATALGAEDA